MAHADSDDYREKQKQMSRNQRLGLLAIAAALIVAAFIVLSPGGDDGDDGGSQAATQTQAETTTTPGSAGATTRESGDDDATTEQPAAPAQPRVPTVRVVGGQPQGGVRRLEFAKGDRIRFRVRSDVADEIHVHGYDRSRDVPAGGTVAFSFPASIEGRFEVELETRGVQIAELEVNPS